MKILFYKIDSMSLPNEKHKLQSPQHTLLNRQHKLLNEQHRALNAIFRQLEAFLTIYITKSIHRIMKEV
jgi:hypothetical protein